MLTLMATLLGFASFLPASTHIEYEQTSLQIEKFISPWALISNKENSFSSKSFVVTAIIHESFSAFVHKIAEISYEILNNTHYLSLYSLIHPKCFFLLI